MLNSALGLIMLVGSYGAASDTTFQTYTFDCASGEAVRHEVLTDMPNASFLALADKGATLFAVNENSDTTASVTMLRRDNKYPTLYTPVATQLTGGADPCHIVVSPDGKYIVTSNYSGGSISIIPFDGNKSTFGEPTIMQFDGSGPVAERQFTPHAHFTSFTPDGKLMIVDDLGTDLLHVFPLDRAGYPILEKMKDVEIAPGSGPRHLVYDRKARNAYLINELSGTVAHLRYNPADSTLTPVRYYEADYEHAGGSADIHISPDGRFLYVSNRLKNDNITAFAVNSDDGSLTPAGTTSTGRHPRNFAITPDGKWLLVACRDDNMIEVFRRNTDDGSLSPTDLSIPCPKPVCIIFTRL